MKKETARLVGEIAALAHEQNAPDYTVFVNYYGHTAPFSIVRISIHERGWEADHKPSQSRDFIEDESQDLEGTLDWMRRIHAEFRALNPAHQRAETVQAQVGATNVSTTT